MLALRPQDSRYIPEWDRDKFWSVFHQDVHVGVIVAIAGPGGEHIGDEGWRLHGEHMEWIEERARRGHGQV
jgi:hypothetical protein